VRALQWASGSTARARAKLAQGWPGPRRSTGAELAVHLDAGGEQQHAALEGRQGEALGEHVDGGWGGAPGTAALDVAIGVRLARSRRLRWANSAASRPWLASSQASGASAAGWAGVFM
jgi:hypothetical protein